MTATIIPFPPAKASIVTRSVVEDDVLEGEVVSSEDYGFAPALPRRSFGRWWRRWSEPCHGLRTPPLPPRSKPHDELHGGQAKRRDRAHRRDEEANR